MLIFILIDSYFHFRHPTLKSQSILALVLEGKILVILELEQMKQI